MDKILYWNTRGACGKSLFRNLKLVCHGPKPTLIILSETRMVDDRHLRVLGRLGFDSFRCIPNEGRSGGLAMIWKSSQVSITVVEEDRQFFHLECKFPQVPIFYLTAIYAVPHSNLRAVLWANIFRLAQGISSPWCVLGDFNDIRSASERVGGGRANTSRIRWFQERINEAGLADMGS